MNPFTAPVTANIPILTGIYAVICVVLVYLLHRRSAARRIDGWVYHWTVGSLLGMPYVYWAFFSKLGGVELPIPLYAVAIVVGFPFLYVVSMVPFGWAGLAVFGARTALLGRSSLRVLGCPEHRAEAEPGGVGNLLPCGQKPWIGRTVMMLVLGFATMMWLLLCGGRVSLDLTATPYANGLFGVGCVVLLVVLQVFGGAHGLH